MCCPRLSCDPSGKRKTRKCVVKKEIKPAVLNPLQNPRLHGTDSTEAGRGGLRRRGHTKEALENGTDAHLPPLLPRILVEVSALAIRPENGTTGLKITGEKAKTAPQSGLLRSSRQRVGAGGHLFTWARPPFVCGWLSPAVASLPPSGAGSAHGQANTPGARGRPPEEKTEEGCRRPSGRLSACREPSKASGGLRGPSPVFSQESVETAPSHRQVFWSLM